MPLKVKTAKVSHETYYAYQPKDDHGCPPRVEPSRKAAIGFDVSFKGDRMTKKPKHSASMVRPIDGAFDGTMFHCVTMSLFSGEQWKPKHLLVPPPERICDSEVVCRPDEFCTREESLRLAAEFNREILATVTEPGVRVRSWAIAVEFGRFKHKSLRSIDLEGRLGVANTHWDQPIRVIRPTADEIARLGSLPKVKAAKAKLR